MSTPLGQSSAAHTVKSPPRRGPSRPRTCRCRRPDPGTAAARHPGPAPAGTRSAREGMNRLVVVGGPAAGRDGLGKGDRRGHVEVDRRHHGVGDEVRPVEQARALGGGRHRQGSVQRGRSAQRDLDRPFEHPGEQSGGVPPVARPRRSAEPCRHRDRRGHRPAVLSTPRTGPVPWACVPTIGTPASGPAGDRARPGDRGHAVDEHLPGPVVHVHETEAVLAVEATAGRLVHVLEPVIADDPRRLVEVLDVAVTPSSAGRRRPEDRRVAVRHPRAARKEYSITRIGRDVVSR